MILIWLGRVSLYVALAALVGGILDQLRALRQGRQGHALWWATAALVGIVGGVGAKEYALITHNFSLAYVAENNATFTPLLYSITGMWSALEGSLLLWSLLLTVVTLSVIYYYRREATDAVVGWATVVLFGVGAFFTYLLVAPASPFVHNPAHHPPTPPPPHPPPPPTTPPTNSNPRNPRPPSKTTR